VCNFYDTVERRRERERHDLYAEEHRENFDISPLFVTESLPPPDMQQVVLPVYLHRELQVRLLAHMQLLYEDMPQESCSYQSKRIRKRT